MPQQLVPNLLHASGKQMDIVHRHAFVTKKVLTTREKAGPLSPLKITSYKAL